MTNIYYYRFLFSVTAFIYPLWGVIFHFTLSENEPIYERALFSPFLLLFAYFSPSLYNVKGKNINIYLTCLIIFAINAHFLYLVDRSLDWGAEAHIANIIGYLLIIMATGLVVTTFFEALCWIGLSLIGTFFITKYINFVPPEIYFGWVVTIILFAVGTFLYLYHIKRREKIQRDENIQNSNLVAIGKMSSIISHEVNNNLQIVNTLLFNLNHKNLINDDVYERIKKSNHKVSDLLSNICSIAPQTKSQSKRFPLKPKIESLINIFDTKIKEMGGECEINVDESFEIQMAEEDFTQGFLNILQNCFDHASLDKKLLIKIYTQKNKLCIEANTKKINQQDSEKVFMPFYSTKDINEGSGLGLTVSQRLFKNYGIEISLSNGDIGPRFCIHFGSNSAK